MGPSILVPHCSLLIYPRVSPDILLHSDQCGVRTQKIYGTRYPFRLFILRSNPLKMGSDAGSRELTASAAGHETTARLTGLVRHGEMDVLMCVCSSARRMHQWSVHTAAQCVCVRLPTPPPPPPLSLRSSSQNITSVAWCSAHTSEIRLDGCINTHTCISTPIRSHTR